MGSTGGDAASDAILRQAADACRGAVQGSDTVARLGGEKFAVILENCGAANADQIARQLIQALNPLAINGETKVTHKAPAMRESMSVHGIAAATPIDTR